MNAKTNQLADLTSIKGIGPNRQEWLRKSFNVQTYADLAALSADELEAQLKATGRIAARNEIEAWIAQAQLLAAPINPVPPSDQAVSPSETTPVANPTMSESKPWDAVASYVVEFQTRLAETQEKQTPEYRTAVQYMDADVGKAWPGLQTDELGAWMLEQVREKGKKEPVAALLAEPQAALGAPLQVAIKQIHIFQSPDIARQLMVSELDQPLQVLNISGAPFALEIAFALTSPGATANVSQETRAITQCQAHNLTTGAKIYLGEVRDTVLITGQTRQTVRLANLSLPPGLYRLRIAVAIQSRPPCADYVEVPLIQVV